MAHPDAGFVVLHAKNVSDAAKPLSEGSILGLTPSSVEPVHSTVRSWTLGTNNLVVSSTTAAVVSVAEVFSSVPPTNQAADADPTATALNAKTANNAIIVTFTLDILLDLLSLPDFAPAGGPQFASAGECSLLGTTQTLTHTTLGPPYSP